MRVAIFLVLIGCGSDNPAGSLVCKASTETGSPRVTVAVPAHGLAATRDRAERIGNLVDCTFEEAKDGPPTVALRTLEDDNIERKLDAIRDQLDNIDPKPSPRLPTDNDDDDPLAPPPPPPPPPPAPPRNVAPAILEANRLAGTKMIQPDDATRIEIMQSGKSRIVGSFKMCITTTGEVSTVSQLKSTGFDDYDKKLIANIREWKYRPYEVDGDPVPVCTAVTFIYSAP